MATSAVNSASVEAGVPLYKNGWVVLPAALVFPPAGLVLLWLRGRPGIFLKLAASLAIVILGVVHLFMFYGLRAEMDGTGMMPILTFHSPQRDIAALEKQRATQAASMPPQVSELAATPAPVEAAPAAPTAEKPTAAGAPKLVAAKAPAVAAASKSSESAATPAATAPPAPDAYWSDFRGPRRAGVYAEKPLLSTWPAGGLKPLWKQPIGGGYATFVIAQGKLFTIEQRRDKEVVVAYDAATGRELWTHAWAASFQEAMGGDGPRATPVWHEGRLYALGATGEFRCLDAASGKAYWAKNILTDNAAENLTWGMAAAPLVVDDKVIVQPGGAGKSVVAYDRLTGRRIWSSKSDKQAYTSPMLVTLAGQRQLLVVSAQRAMGMTVEDGTMLWEYPWTTEYDVNAAQPIIVDENHFFISAGYGHGAALVHVQRDAAGKYTVMQVWKNLEMKNKFSSSVLYQGHIYGLDEGILACIDARTGARKWKGGRYGHGQLLLSGDRLIVITEQGDLVLLRATPEKQDELARFSAIEGKTWNNMALSAGRLYVRNTREMAAFDLLAR